jgi:hypothetical protein
MDDQPINDGSVGGADDKLSGYSPLTCGVDARRRAGLHANDVGLSEYLSSHPLDRLNQRIQIGEWMKLALSREPQTGPGIPAGDGGPDQAFDICKSGSMSGLELCV